MNRIWGTMAKSISRNIQSKQGNLTRNNGCIRYGNRYATRARQLSNRLTAGQRERRGLVERGLNAAAIGNIERGASRFGGIVVRLYVK